MTVTSVPSSVAAPALSRLYAARFVFALAWGAAVLLAGSELTLFVGTLLVLYPVYDIIAIAADARLSGSAKPRTALYFNLLVSAIAAVGLAIATTSGVPAVLSLFGAWAIVSGVAQLVVGQTRRSMGGQLPMVLSGAISVLAGGSFVAMSSGDDPSLSALGGYALIGGLFFLVSSILLRRRSNG